MNIPTVFLAAGPLVTAMGVVMGPVLCGLAFAVLSMGSFNGVHEDLNNPKPNPGHAISRGYSHLLMCSIVFATLMVVSPLLGAFTPLIPVLLSGAVSITALAALCNGGYDHLHETWSNSGVKTLKNILWFIDKALSFIPARVRSILGAPPAKGIVGEEKEGLLSKLHPWLGPFYLTAQIGLFTGIAVAISPALGIAGLGYFGMEFARSQNKLPIFVGVVFEKFRSVMEIVSGFFTNNNILHLYSVYKLISASILSATSYVNFGSNNVVSELTVISTHGKITSEKFNAVRQQIPVSKLETKLHKGGMGKDVNKIFDGYAEYYEKYRNDVIAARQNSYAEFEKLASSGLLDRAKYYLGYIPMNLRTYLPINSYYNPSMFNSYTVKVAASNTLGITKTHMQHGQVVMPAPAAVEFSQFITVAMTKIAGNNERTDLLKCLLTDLVNFKEFKKQKAIEAIAKIEPEELAKINETIDDLNYDINKLNKFKEYHDKCPAIIEQMLESLCDESKTVHDAEKAPIVVEVVKGVSVRKQVNRDYYKLIWSALYAQDPNNVATKIKSKEEAKVILQQLLSMDAVNKLKDKVDELEIQRGTKFSTEVYLEFFESRLKVFCDKVKDGNVAWDKSVTSVDLWQSKSKHLIHYITGLLESQEEEKIGLAYNVLTSLVEATDECAESIFTTVEKFYYNLVKPQFILQQKMSAKDLVAINMTHIRNKVFDRLYGEMAIHPKIKSGLFFMDFYDKHDQSYIRRATQHVLHLSSDDGLTSGDLSRKNVDVLKEIGARSISWLGYRLLTACEQDGYSADGIIMEMWDQFKNYNVGPYSVQDTTCPIVFNAYSCLRNWADSLQDPIKAETHKFIDDAISMELDTVKLIKALSESKEKDRNGVYIAKKLEDLSVSSFLAELDNPEDDDDEVQQYITKVIRNVNRHDINSLATILSGLKHCDNTNVRAYVNKRIKCNEEGVSTVDVNEFLAELNEFQTNKQIRDSIRAKISAKNDMEIQVKQLLSLMLIETGVFEINSPELKKETDSILNSDPITNDNSPSLELELQEDVNKALLFSAPEQRSGLLGRRNSFPTPIDTSRSLDYPEGVDLVNKGYSNTPSLTPGSVSTACTATPRSEHQEDSRANSPTHKLQQ